MSTIEELMEERREISRKNHELHVYLAESRKIQGDISQIAYRHNSGIYVSHGEIKRMEGLKKEIREKNSELRRCHGLSPGQVENQIRKYGHTLARIEKQLDEMTKSGQQPPEPEDVLGGIVEERPRLKGLEDRLTETGIQLLKEQAAHHGCPAPQGAEPKSDYDRFYEQPAGSNRQPDQSSPELDR